MPKFRVKIKYCQWIYETYEVVVAKPGFAEVISPEELAEELEEFRESPYDFCSEKNRVSRVEGDLRDGSFSEDVEEINALDQIVEALDA